MNADRDAVAVQRAAARDRDVKPDNLMINHGIVKVAYLFGSSTRDGSDNDALPQNAITDPQFQVDDGPQKRSSRTSPSLIPQWARRLTCHREQCRDAAAVDPRADIYSLGCSIYAVAACGQAAIPRG